MKKRDYGWIVSAPFFAVHLVAIAGVAYYGWSWKGFGLAVAFYYLRMFGVTGAYHRYFSHRTYRTSRWFQFCLAFLAQTSLQKGALWWAAHHRDHHKFSDTKKDPHSWREYGFWYSHVGWILDNNTEETIEKNIPDLMRYPELRWLNKWHVVPGVLFAVATYFLGNGIQTLLWGFFVSTALLWHGTFSINSLAHWWGRRRYNTTDDSKNSLALALVTMGEGWHNNHHYYQRSVRQGFFWWELDLTYYILRTFQAVGLVWDLQLPPQKVLEGKLEEGRRRAVPGPTGMATDVSPEPTSVSTIEAAAE